MTSRTYIDPPFQWGIDGLAADPLTGLGTRLDQTTAVYLQSQVQQVTWANSMRPNTTPEQTEEGSQTPVAPPPDREAVSANRHCRDGHPPENKQNLRCLPTGQEQMRLRPSLQDVHHPRHESAMCRRAQGSRLLPMTQKTPKV
jgi:hypothetical protein